MRIAIIGRSEVLFRTAERLARGGHDVVLIVTAREAPEYTKTSRDFEVLASSLGAAFLYAPRIAERLDVIQSVRPLDIGVSFNYTSIVPQEVIDCFRLGILNAHGGDLPRYRGNACQAWAILTGETRIGLCVHRMIGGEIDSGDIIARDYLPIDERTKVTAVWNWMADRVPALYAEALDALERDPSFVLARQSRDPKDVLRCYPRRPEDGRIEWTRSATHIMRLVNASNIPYEGAFCEFEGERITVWDAELVDDEENFLAVEGQVTRIGNGFVEVACGSGKLRLTEIEVAGTRRSPSDVIRSIRKRLL